MTASLLTEEHSAIESGYAWLVFEAGQDGNLFSGRASSKAGIPNDFDELVAAQIVARLRRRESVWTIRATGDVVLNVLEQLGLLTVESSLVPVRILVSRAHRIARQIIPAASWSGE